MVNEQEYRYIRLASLGDFYPLDIQFDLRGLHQQLASDDLIWPPYSNTKPWSQRSGLSLFSLNGEVTGEIDLNSLREWNEAHGTQYNEASFRTPTPYWARLSHISEPLKCLTPHLGRTHVIRFDPGGFFPPHRDSYEDHELTFRLISFVNCSPISLHVALDGRLIHFEPGLLYFMNTRKIHSLFSFEKDAYVLVFNVIVSEASEEFVIKNLMQK